MSQEKIDKRKLSKGDILHATKKRMRNTTLIVSGVLIAVAVLASVLSYHAGYEKGDAYGESNAFNLYQALYGTGAAATTEAATTEPNSNAVVDDKATTADETKTAGEKETTEAETTTAAE